MKYFKKIEFGILLLFMVMNIFTYAQKFEKRYNLNLGTGTYDFNQVSGCIKRHNGNNLIAVYQKHNAQGATMLIELTPHGDTVWTKEFNRGNASYGENFVDQIRETSDHGLIMTGATHYSSITQFNAAIWKADSVGNITHYKELTCGAAREIRLSDISVGPDGSVYFAGNYSDFYSGGVITYSWTVPLYGKFDSNLNLVWSKTYGSTTHTYNNNNIGAVYSLKLTSDGNLLLMGSDAYDYNNNISGKFMLVKMNTAGTILWSKERVLTYNYIPIGMDIAPDGSIYVLSKHRQSAQFGNVNADMVIEKFDANANQLWGKIYGNAYTQDPRFIKYNTTNNQLAIAGNYEIVGNENKIWLAILDSNGTVNQSRYFGESGNVQNYYYSAAVTNNNYLVCGTSGGYGGLLVQTDLNGNTACAANNASISVANLPISSFINGMFHSSFTITVTNHTTNYIHVPYTVNTTCYACSDVTITNNVSAYGSYFVGGALQTASGTYTDIYPISGGCDSTVITNLTINLSLPDANFSASATTIYVGQSVNFTDLTTNAPTAWSWTFNGASPSNSSTQNPSNIVYNTPGCFTVTLTATNPNGNNTQTNTCYITVNPIPVTPVANFIASTISITAGQSVNFTDLSSNTPTVWNWSFPGAATTTSTLQNPTNIVYNTPGCYQVTLTAGNTAGSDSEIKPCYINVNPVVLVPVANFTSNATVITAGQSVNFTDLSTNSPTSWSWSFTGAVTTTSTQQNPSNIVYNTPGCYQVSLTASNSAGNNTKTTVCYITVNAIVLVPVANFTASSFNITTGQSVNFTDLSTNSPTSWSWTLTGAATTTSTLQNPNNIVYNTAGCFQVSLTATNAAGSNTKTLTCYITVSNIVITPVANFTANTFSITTGQSVNFTDLSTNNPTSWSWTFTGAATTTSTLQNPNNIVYNSAGCFQVSLTATNSAGSNTKTLTCYITVTPPNLYCIPVPTNGTSDGDFINSVTLGTISNLNTGSASGPSYTNYSSLTTTLSSYNNYSLIVQNGTYATDTIAAWIDYNNDNDFNDVGEKLDQLITSNANSNYTLNFTVPGGTTIGTKRLRVRIAFSTAGIANMDPCTNYGYGETEDYSVNIITGTPPLPVANFTANVFNITTGQSVNFTDLSTNNPTSWNWTFTGGTPASSTSQNPTNIIYNTPGCYQVALTASNAGGNNTATQTCYINVTAPAAPCTELFFSEYLEGIANDKALEIYNPSAASINLSGYSIEMYANGAVTPTVALPLTGSILSHEVYVIANISASVAILAAADFTTNGVCNFNGNDAVVLKKNGIIIDVIGEVGINPGSAWNVGAGSTLDNTIVRNASVNGPSNLWSTSQTQFSSYAVGTTTYLGANTNNCAGIVIIPVANFTSNTQNITTGQSVNFTDLSTNNPTSWSWTFTGGTPTSSTSQNPTNITYNTPGCYQVSLTATNSAGNNTSTQTCYITVTNAVITPVANFTSNTQNITTGQSVNFTDLSTNNPTSWSWTFTGATPASSTSQNPTNITYNTPGCYQVSLTATNSAGNNTSTQTCYITVTNAVITPVANFTSNSQNITTGQSINFNDLSTNNPTSWSWTFTGGTPSSSTSQNPTNITYNTPGCYQVSLTATNSAGNNTSTQTCYITVTNAVITPVANFTSNTQNITTGQSVNFTDLSTNNPTSWSWTFTGGTPSSSTAQNPTNITYNTPGCYQVSLTATNSVGSNTSTQTCYITVTNVVITPVANFTSNTQNITTGQSVNFTDLSTNNPTSWSWTFTGGTPSSSTTQNPTNITYNAPGCYQVSLTATNSAGSNTSTQTCYINVTNPVIVPVANFSASSLNITTGQSINFTDLSTNNPTSWSWSFQGAAPAFSTTQNPTNITYNTPGCYQVALTATNSAGNNTSTQTCYITVANPIITPVANFTANTQFITVGQSVNFTDLSTNNPTSWAWVFTGAAPASGTLQNPSNITYNTAGCYQVALTATNSAGSNTSTQTCFINVVPAGIQPQANFSINPNPACTNVTINLLNNSTNALSFNWEMIGATPSTSTAQFPVINYASAGTYQIKLIAINGANSDTLTQSIIINPTPTVNAGNDVGICFGSSVTLNANAVGTLTYSWTPAATLSTPTQSQTVATPTAATDYVVTVNDGVCSASDTIMVMVWSLPTTPTITQVGNNLEATTGFAAYQWYENNILIAGETQQVITPLSNGNYTVDAIDTNGCISTSQTFPFVIQGVNNWSNNQINIYPNPATNKLNIAFPIFNNDTYYQITNLQGQIIKSSKINSDMQNINIETLATGSYFLKIISKDFSESILFLKQ